jgi:hypothetical protein
MERLNAYWLRQGYLSLYFFCVNIRLQYGFNFFNSSPASNPSLLKLANHLCSFLQSGRLLNNSSNASDKLCFFAKCSRRCALNELAIIAFQNENQSWIFGVLRHYPSFLGPIVCFFGISLQVFNHIIIFRCNEAGQLETFHSISTASLCSNCSRAPSILLFPM